MIIRHVQPSDAKNVLVLMKKLAVFEGYRDNFKVSEATIITKKLYPIKDETRDLIKWLKKLSH